MDEHEPFTVFRLPVENTLNDKKECDRRKISETNVVFDDNVTSEMMIRDLFKGPQKNNDEANSVSDENLMALKRRERKTLRRCKMWQREHIDDIEHELAVQKSKKRMIVPGTVVEKIETSKFDMENMMEETVSAFEGKCLVFADRDCKNESYDAKINRNILSEIDDQLNTINGSFMEIVDQWEENRKKEDLLVVCDDFVEFKTRTCGFLGQKDAMIEKLVERLDELNFKLEIQIENNSDELVLLNELAENNIRSTEEVHEKHFETIAELIDNEMTKKTKTDAARWKALIDSTITDITSEGSKRLETIEKNDIELIRQHETLEDDILHHKVSEIKKNIGVEADLEMTKLKYAQKIEEYRYNCHDLQNRIDHSRFRLDSQRNQIALLQERKDDLQEKHKTIVVDYQIQVPSIEKQIANTTGLIEKNQDMIRVVEKRNCANYMKIWNIDENRITTNVENLLRSDCAIHEYLDADRTLSSWETPTAADRATTPNSKPVDGLVLFDRGAENSADSRSYERARDSALNQLLLDFVERNASFVFDAGDRTLRSSCAYGALAALKLDDEHSWNLFRSELKPFVTCAVCKTGVHWKPNATEDAENDTDRTACGRWREMDSENNLLEKLFNHVTRHNENIDKVTRPDPKESDDNATGGPDPDRSENVGDEEQRGETGHDDVSQDGRRDSTAAASSSCANAEHQLSVDDGRFWSVMTTVVGEKRKAERSCRSPGPRNGRDECARWELSDDDLARYWFRFARVLPANSVRLWDASRAALERHMNALQAHKRKRLRLAELRNENDKLQKELCSTGTKRNRFAASK